MHRKKLRMLLAAIFGRLGPLVGAEIGVHQGGNSWSLLKTFPLLTLFMVDDWSSPMRRRPERSKDMEKARDAVGAALGRAVMIRGKSVDVAKLIAPGSLDFIFIDASHTYEAVVEDLAAWVPKVRSGGVLAGHDYGTRSAPMVKVAIDEWGAATGRKIETARGRLWWTRKE